MPTKEKDDEKEPGLEIDFQIFEQQIDDEIDRLFVPLGAQDEMTEEAPVETGQAPQGFKPPAPSPAEARGAPPPPSFAPGVEERRPTQPAMRPPEPKAPPAPAGSPERQEPPAIDADRRAALVESFSVAYLSLDWEFSRENVGRLDQALGRLTPFCQGMAECRSLYTILKVILSQLNSEPESISPRIAELIRDVQELLKDLIVADEGIDPGRKAQFRELVGRVRAMRDEGLLGKKQRVEVPATQKASPVTKPRIVFVDEAPAAELESLEGQPLGELGQWMRSHRFRSREGARRLQEESERLLQVEQVLGKTPALALVVARLTKIRTALDEHVQLIEEADGEWGERLQGLPALQAKIHEQLAAAPLAVEPEASESVPEAVSIMETGEPMLEETSPGEIIPAEPAQVSVCSYLLSGARLAIPASHVVKVAPISPKRASKIRERGYARLVDFKPLFRSIRTGVLGSWRSLPARSLDSYQFIALPSRILRGAGTPAIPGTAILVSNGERHGIVFAEPNGVRFSDEDVRMVDGEKGLMGIIESEGASSVEVLNMDEILNDYHDSGTK